MPIPIRTKISQPSIIDFGEEDNNIGFNIDDIVVKAKTTESAKQSKTKLKQLSESISEIKKPTLPAPLSFNNNEESSKLSISKPKTVMSTMQDKINTNNIVTSTPNSNVKNTAGNPILNKLLPDTTQTDAYEKKLDSKFSDSNQLLYQTICQADYIFNKVEEELDKYKKNSAFGGKSRSLSMSTLLNTQANILSTKINAIKESNNVRKTIADNILKRDQMQMQARMKVFAPKDEAEVNSDKAISDAYYSLINASRYGLPTIHNPLAQSSINTGISLQGNIIPTSSLNPIVTANPGEMVPQMQDPLNSFLTNNMTPSQKRMVLEHNPNVKIVVFYDQSTGGKKFEALDVNSGKIIPGVQLPASFLLEDMRIDFNNAIAYNSSANLNYPLVVVGRRAVDEL